MTSAQARLGERNGNAKLTAGEVAAIRALWAAGDSQRELARYYEVSQVQIRRIVLGRNWREDPK